MKPAGRTTTRELISVEPLDLITRERIALVCSDAPKDERVKALAFLERVPPREKRGVARGLVRALAAEPDVAGRVHLALLSLDPDLAIGRDEDGFVASVVPLSRVTRTEGRAFTHDVGLVAGLDSLAQLFDPGDDVPQFLAPPKRDAPAQYRPSAEVLAKRAEEEARELARMAAEMLAREKLRALGLDEEDLDDDPPIPRPPFVPRGNAPIVAHLPVPTLMRVRVESDFIELGIARAGAWWSAERAGDARGARRLHLRLDRDEPAVNNTIRRERALDTRQRVVVIELGAWRTEHRVAGRGVIAWIEQEAGEVVGLTITWWVPPAPKPIDERVPKKA